MQAVALVFDHVLVEMEQMGSNSLLETALPAPSEPSSAKGPETPRGSKSPRGHGTTNAALKLLDDLCMMATGDLALHPKLFVSSQDLLIRAVLCCRHCCKLGTQNITFSMQQEASLL